MKVLILAGGMGTRLAEETSIIPKPMVEIGGHPILWHIMKIYSRYGYNDFIILLGYKGYIIKEYFANYFLHRSDVTFDLKNNQMTWSGEDSQRVHCKSVMSFSFADPDNGEVVIDNCYVNETQLLKGFVFLESAAKSFTYKNVVIDGVDCGYQNEEEYKSA